MLLVILKNSTTGWNYCEEGDALVMDLTALTRVNAAALIKFHDFLMWRLLKLIERNDSG